MGTNRMRPRSAARRRRATRHGLIAGITTFLLLVGTGVSYAAWTAGAEATSTASAATLAISTSGFDSSNAFTFQNHRLTTTGSVTLTNTTDTSNTTSGTYTMTLGYTGDAALASNLTVTMWPTTDPSGCATIVGSQPGTVAGQWDTVATTAAPLTGSLAKGATQSYCIRVSSAERGQLAATAGALTIQPSISASLKVHSWSQSASATTTQSTAWIFPAFGPTPNTWYQVKNQGTGMCLDVYAAAATSGTGAIDYGCKAGNALGDYNQEWEFTRSMGDYFDMTPRHAQAVRLDVVGGSITTLAAVDVQTDSGSRVSQEWQLQKQPPGDVYQIVNRNSGLCLQVNDTSVYTSNVEYAQAVCDGTPGQRYTLIEKDVDIPAMTLSCAAGVNGGVNYSWTGAAIDTYNFQARPNSGGAYGSIGSPVAAGATSFTVLPAAISGADGQYNVQALWLANQLATSNLWKMTSGATTTLSCAAPPALQCTDVGNGGNRTVIFSFTPSAPQSFKLQVNTTGAVWVDMMGTNFYPGSGSVTISGDPPFNLSAGTYPVRAMTAGGSVVGTSSLVVTVQGNKFLRCA